MRKSIWIIFAVVILFVGLINSNTLVSGVHDLVYYSPCNTPITYKIDTVDSRFNISKEKFSQIVTKAEDVWGTVYGKDLFVQKPNGEISVNLVYDQRQYLNSQISQMDSDLNDKKNDIVPKIDEYEKRVKDFNDRISKLNDEIKYWNSKGGAPASEFERLSQEQNDLKNEANELNIMANQLNESKDQYNSQINKLNKTIEQYDNVLKYKPEEGVYQKDNDKKEIDIYFDVSDQELEHTLIHEFGHALGMDHIDKVTSIMYPLTTDTINPSEDDINQLNLICKPRSILFK